MSYKLTRSLRLATFLSGLAVLGGCANTAEMDQLRQMASDAMTAAQQAQQDASRAQATADSAAAQASDAMQRAEDANACCQANTERMDKMFKKSMMK